MLPQEAGAASLPLAARNDRVAADRQELREGPRRLAARQRGRSRMCAWAALVLCDGEWVRVLSGRSAPRSIGDEAVTDYLVGSRT